MARYQERDFVVGFPFATYVKKIGRTYAMVADRLELPPKIIANYAQRGRLPLAVYRRLINAYGGAGLPAPKTERGRSVTLPDSYNEDTPALPAPPVTELSIPLKEFIQEPEVKAPRTPTAAAQPAVAARSTSAEIALAREIARHAVEILVEQLTAVTHDRDILVMERDRLLHRNEELEAEVEIANQLLAEHSERARNVRPLPAVATPKLEGAMEIIRDVAKPEAAKALNDLEARLPKRERTG